MEQKGNCILIDWLTFTSHCDDTSTMISFLGLESATWEELPKGRNGYKSRMCFENISILFDGQENMGICVDITGTGCRAFESYSSRGWEDMIRELLEDPQSYNITRLDMAFDDHSGILDIDELRDDTDDHNYVSRSRTWEVDYGSEGTTIYHGSKKSNMLIRIYDKAAERNLENEHWVRVEMQMRDEIASGFLAGALINCIGIQYCGVLHNYLRYVVPQADTNMSRWPLADYWALLLDDVGRLRVWSTPGVEYDVFKLAHLVENQWGNAIDCYLSIYGTEHLIETLGQRAIRRSPKYERLKAQYKKVLGSKISKVDV